MGIATQGLVLFLPFLSPDLQGSTIISKDTYLHSCSVTGATWTNQGRDFNGSGDNIIPAFNSVLRPSTALTIEAYLSLDTLAAGGGTRDIYVARTGGNSFQFLVLGSGYGGNAGKIYFSRWSGAVEAAYVGSVVGTATKLSVAFTYDSVGNVSQCYRDGIADGAAGTATGAIDTVATGVSVGNGNWDGPLGVLRVYNRALSAAELLANFNEDVKGFKPCWDFFTWG